MVLQAAAARLSPAGFASDVMHPWMGFHDPMG